ncbi:MAG: hypothetical protein M3Y35_13935 [Actinomycetota bacterium]|nr:hypothetical protein [Actinomycetota bacterium]
MSSPDPRPTPTSAASERSTSARSSIAYPSGDNVSNTDPLNIGASRDQQLSDQQLAALRSKVPLTTHILVVGVMMLFFSIATLITLQASVIWWLIPVLVAVPVGVVLTQRWKTAAASRAARRSMEAEMRRSGRPL